MIGLTFISVALKKPGIKQNGKENDRGEISLKKQKDRNKRNKRSQTTQPKAKENEVEGVIWTDR